MQIGESIAVTVTMPEKDGPCWFCEEEPKGKDLKNEEDADPDTSAAEAADSVPENDTKNDASKLGKNLKDKPEWTIICPENGKDTKVLSAAHHCIPGNAAFKKASKLLKFIRKDGPLKLISDIGYSINHRNNGVWLPGNYYVRSGNSHYKKNWGAYENSFKDDYARLAIKKAGVQFHDAHSDYNKNVLDTLNDMAGKIKKPTDKCPVCGKKYEKTRPPFGLVGRLDLVSSKHRSMIATISKKAKKFVKAGYYTSSHVKKYFRIS